MMQPTTKENMRDTLRYMEVKCERCGNIVKGYFPKWNKATGQIERYCVNCIDKVNE